MQRGARTHAAARRRPIKLTISEDANVTTVTGSIECWSTKDRAVKKTQIWFHGMSDRKFRHHRSLDSPAIVDDTLCVLRNEFQTYIFGVNERIERAAVGDIKFHRANSFHVNVL